MSNVYYIVDLDRRSFIQFMDAEVKTHCDTFLDNLSASFEKAPTFEDSEKLQGWIQNSIKAYIQKVAGGSCFPSILSETLAIGTMTPHQFFWRRDNGFQSPEDVRAYLDGHPSCQIYDQYEVPVSWEEFQALM